MLYVFAIFSLVVFSVYSFGVSPSAFGGDSGDVILSAWFGGIAHAPGYPLNAMIGWFFTHLPYNASVAFKANLMAAFVMALASGVLFLTLQKLIKHTFVSLITSTIFVFNPLIWLYSHIIEVFQLNLVLVAVSFYFLVCWRESVLAKKTQQKFIYIAFLFWGLAFFHHQTSILLAPTFFYMIFKTHGLDKKKSTMFKLLVFFLLGFVPNFYLIFASFQNSPTNWVELRTLGDFFKLITRAEYGSFVAAGSLLGAGLASRLSEIFYFFLLLKTDFQIVATVLIFVGAIYSFIKDRVIFLTILIAVMFTGPLFLFYAAFPISGDFYQGLWERFVLITYFFLTIYIAYGFKFLLEFSERKIARLVTNKVILKVFVLATFTVFLTVPFGLFYTNYIKADFSAFKLGDWLGADFLASADDNGVIFLLGDTITFNTEYFYYTNLDNEHIRSLHLVRGGSLSDLEYRERLIDLYSDLNAPPEYYEDIRKEGMHFITLLVNANKNKFPIYIVEDPPSVQGYRWMSVGLLEKLVSEDDYTGDLVIQENQQKFRNFKFVNFESVGSYEHFLVTDLKRLYYVYILRVSDELIAFGKLDDAQQYLNRALLLNSENKEVYLRIAHIFYVEGSCDKSLDNYKKGLSLDKKDWRILVAISSLYKDCFKDDDFAKSYLDQANYLRSSLEDKSLKSF